MSFGFGFGFPSWRTLAGGFSPAALFVGGVQGAWYDPSDLSTLFDSSTGTTPVSMPGQGAAVPVGAMLDKRASAYSVYFDGAGDCLTTPNSADLQLGSTYTVECWVYRTGTGTNIRIFSDGNTNVNNVDIYIAAGTNFISFFGGFTSSAYVLPLNTWVHIALVVTAGIPALYANGIAQTLSGTLTGVNSTATTTRIIGALTSLGTYGFVGNIFNLRVVKGTAVYTGNFTPPTAPLSPITGTSLLTCGTTWSGNPAITTVGNTRVDGLNPFTASPVGNHAISFNNTTARPELRARVNLLTYSEDWANAVWTGVSDRTNVTTTPNAGTNPIGGSNATRLQGTANNWYQGQTVSLTSLTPLVLSLWVKSNTGSSQTFRLFGTGGSQISSNLTATTDWQQFLFPYTPTNTTQQCGIIRNSSNSTADLLIWGADLRPANIGANVPAYQRIADANTYDTSGFPLYLYFDGTDDSMYTPANLDLSGTDKATVFAGVRKLSASVRGMLVELSATAANQGAFNVCAPEAADDYSFTLTGNAGSPYYQPAGYAAPISNVVSCGYDFAGALRANEIAPRINGVLAQSGGAGAAAGTNTAFLSAPLFIGSRNNASVRLNAQLYSLIIAGSAVSAGNISATESWVAGRTGIQI